MYRNTPVLFVDDEPNILASFKRQFGRRFQVVTANNAEEALNMMAAGQTFAVVISDMRMPGMDGTSFLSEMRRLAPRTMRVMLTGLLEQPVAVRAINDAHVFAFLNKPVEFEVLEGVIERALGLWSIRKHETEFLEGEREDIALA